jgi:hypothetical protein
MIAVLPAPNAAHHSIVTLHLALQCHAYVKSIKQGRAMQIEVPHLRRLLSSKDALIELCRCRADPYSVLQPWWLGSSSRWWVWKIDYWRLLLLLLLGSFCDSS